VRLKLLFANADEIASLVGVKRDKLRNARKAEPRLNYLPKKFAQNS
jgi:hypothetical protein